MRISSAETSRQPTTFVLHAGSGAGSGANFVIAPSSTLTADAQMRQRERAAHQESRQGSQTTTRQEQP